MKKVLILFFIVYHSIIQTASGNEDKTYTGSVKCSKCHEKEYSQFSQYSKKAKSYDSIMAMRSRLTESEFKSCFECHTTGYGKPGGFVSETETPELKNAGCEVCHGPGSKHVESEDPQDIKVDLSIEDCKLCHNSDRIEEFSFRPLLFGGAH